MTKWSHLEPQYILSSCHKAKKLTNSLQVLAPATLMARESCSLHWQRSPFQGYSLTTNVLVHSVSKCSLRPCHVPATACGGDRTGMGLSQLSPRGLIP